MGGRLIKVESLLAACETGANNGGCAEVLQTLKNPYFLRKQPAGTQTSGWVDAWQSAASAYAVPAHTTSDVVAAINFARYDPDGLFTTHHGVGSEEWSADGFNHP